AFYSGLGAQKDLKITTWDAFGYYAYLPATFIFHDVEQLKWVDSVDKKYNLTGNGHAPVEVLEDGNKVLKYLNGVALAEMPFFFIAHFTAPYFGYPQDGFSAPYQYALGFGIIFYS